MCVYCCWKTINKSGASRVTQPGPRGGLLLSLSGASSPHPQGVGITDGGSLSLALPGSSGPPRQGVDLAGGGSLSLALAGSSGLSRQGVGIAGGGSLSLALPASSVPPCQGVRLTSQILAALSSRFRLARERVILSAAKELPTSVTLLLSISTKFAMVKS